MAQLLDERYLGVLTSVMTHDPFCFISIQQCGSILELPSRMCKN